MIFRRGTRRTCAVAPHVGLAFEASQSGEMMVAAKLATSNDVRAVEVGDLVHFVNGQPGVGPSSFKRVMGFCSWKRGACWRPFVGVAAGACWDIDPCVVLETCDLSTVLHCRHHQRRVGHSDAPARQHLATPFIPSSQEDPIFQPCCEPLPPFSSSGHAEVFDFIC